MVVRTETSNGVVVRGVRRAIVFGADFLTAGIRHHVVVREGSSASEEAHKQGIATGATPQAPVHGGPGDPRPEKRRRGGRLPRQRVPMGEPEPHHLQHCP